MDVRRRRGTRTAGRPYAVSDRREPCSLLHFRMRVIRIEAPPEVQRHEFVHQKSRLANCEDGGGIGNNLLRWVFLDARLAGGLNIEHEQNIN